tara:strand:+ start:8835 stop:10703 length:1869 start_codon:yes stop_codon:yes gene_type:complete
MAELSDIFESGGWPEEKPKKTKVVIDIKDYALEAILSAVLGFYAAFVFWDVWSIGVKGLGFNATIFIYVLTALLVVTRTKERPLAYRDQTWIVPSLVISLSFSLYENSFFEPLNCFIFPAVLIWNFVASSDHLWGRLLHTQQALTDAGVRILSVVFASFMPAWRAYVSFVSRSSKVDHRTVERITWGVCLLIVILPVVIWLLFSADQVFAFRIENLGTWLGEVLDTSLFLKIPVAVLIAVVLLGICIRQKADAPDEDVVERTSIDSLVSGIVLSGVLTIYFLFLFVQAEQLWMDSLPIEVDEITSLVKTGFWQLVALSLINVFGFMLLYRTTNRTVQILLSVFVLASTLVLSSSAHKLYLYIASTGLSYEKFYSSYVVAFCAVLLTLLFWFSVKKKAADTVRSTLLLFTVMYSVVSVLPVSQLIYHVNSELAKTEDASQWLKGGAWAQELEAPTINKNVEDFMSLATIAQPAGTDEARNKQLCLRFWSGSKETVFYVHSGICDVLWLSIGRRGWVINIEDYEQWKASADSNFSRHFIEGVRGLDNYQSLSINSNGFRVSRADLLGVTKISVERRFGRVWHQKSLESVRLNKQLQKINQKRLGIWEEIRTQFGAKKEFLELLE